MEELKLIIEMVANLPAMALWVLIGFWIYKTLIIGSIYGVIRLAIIKTHDWLTRPKTREVRPLIDGMCVTGCKDELIDQLKRIRGKGISISSEYIHGDSVGWLRDAIDDKIAKDAAKKAA